MFLIILLYFIYDYSEQLEKKCPVNTSLLFLQSVSGVLAGFTTTLITNPMDTIRARLQVSKRISKQSWPLNKIKKKIDILNYWDFFSYKNDFQTYIITKYNDRFRVKSLGHKVPVCQIPIVDVT